MPEAEVFALVRDDETIVVNLAALREPINADALCDLLGLSHDEFMDALDRPANDLYRVVFYESVWEHLGGELYDVVDGTVLLPLAESLVPEQVAEWLEYVLSRAGVGGWRLPPGDFEMPRNPALLRQLAQVEKQRPDRMVWFDVVALEGADAAIAELESRIDALSKVMKARRKQIKSQGVWFGSLDRARTLVALQREHWRDASSLADDGEAEAFAKREGALAALDMVLAGVSAEVRSKVVAKLAWSEKHTAELLLALFSEGNTSAASFAQMLRAYSEQPTVLTSTQHQRLVTGLQSAFAMLASSEVVDRFLLNHLLPLLREFCERPDGRLREALVQADETDAARDIADNWREAFDAVEASAGSIRSEQTTLIVLNMLGGGYQALAGVLAAGLHPRLISQFLYYVNIGNTDSRGVLAGRGAWSVATALMRYLGLMATPSKSSGGVRGLSLGEIAYQDVLSRVFRASQGDPSARALLGRMRIDESFMRSSLGTSLSIVANSAAMLYSVKYSDDDDPLTNALGLAQTISDGVLGNALRVAGNRIARDIPSSRWMVVDPALATVEKTSAALSASLSVLALVIQYRTMQRRRARGSMLEDYWKDLVPAAGSITSVGSWIAGLFAASDAAMLGTAGAVAAGLGAAAALLGVGAVVLAVTHLLTETGSAPLFKHLVEHAEGAAHEFYVPQLFKSLSKATSFAEDASAFSTFHGKQSRAGRRGDGESSGIPTWHRMAELGFSPREIALVFDDGAARIAMAVTYGEETDAPR